MIEIVVAAAIGGLVLVILWTLVSTMTRSFSSSRDLLHSLQGAHLLLETIRNDLGSCYYEFNTRPIVCPNIFELSFYTFEPENNPSIQLSSPDAVLEKVTYKFDPATCQVSRNGTVFNFARFERVAFIFQQPDFSNPDNKYFGNFVSIRVTCAPEATIQENLGRRDSQRITKSVVTLITSISIQHKAALETWPFWNRTLEPRATVR